MPVTWQLESSLEQEAANILLQHHSPNGQALLWLRRVPQVIHVGICLKSS